MKVSNAILLLFCSDFHYLAAKEFASLIAARFQIYGLKGLGATSTSLVSGEWLNLNLISQKIISEEFESAEAAVIFIMPTNLSEAVSLTRSSINIAQEKPIPLCNLWMKRKSAIATFMVIGVGLFHRYQGQQYQFTP